MKTSKRLLPLILICSLCLYTFTACEEDRIIGGPHNYTHPEFQTEYTIDEHIDRIRERTMEKFSAEIEKGKIANIEVEILYAFYDNDPEYFMVQLQYTQDFTGSYRVKDESGRRVLKTYATRYKHFIGFIENDEYYVRVRLYSGYGENSKRIAKFIDGRNPYELSGYGDAKKYCTVRHCAVETSEGLLQVFNSYNLMNGGVEFDGYEQRFEQCVIPEDEHKKLMSHDPGMVYNCLY